MRRGLGVLVVVAAWSLWLGGVSVAINSGGRNDAAVWRTVPAARALGKPTEVLVEPRLLEVSDSLASRLGVQFVLPTETIDANSIGLRAPVRSAFGSAVLLLHEQEVLPKTGFDPNNLAAAPPGSLDFEWSVDTFASHAGALAVERAREANLTGLGFQPVHNARLRGLGISAFARRQPDTGLVSQVWYWVDANASLAVSDTGKFTPDALQSDQLRLFKDLRTLLGAVPRLKVAVKPGLSVQEAGREYLAGIQPVIVEEPRFIDQAHRWNAATTGPQARADAQPLINALGHTEQELLRIASGSPPARTDLLVTVGALEVLNVDLADLSRLRTPGSSKSLQRYDLDLGRLTAAANVVRSALGLPPARS